MRCRGAESRQTHRDGGNEDGKQRSSHHPKSLVHRTYHVRLPRSAGTALFVASLALMSACSEDADRGTSEAATASALGAAPPASGRMPADSPEAAVTALLDAEVRSDHDASFHLLSSAALMAYPDAETWFRRRTQLPAITAFRVKAVEGDVVIVTAEHDPGLDAFVGLRAATDTQRWRTVPEGDGWLVEAEPEIAFDLPDDAPAADVATDWASAAQACDASAALALQVEPALLGISSGIARLCGSTDPVVAAPVANIRPGPASADLVAQYGDAAFTWARAVHIDVGSVGLSVLLAPIGDDWRVVGVVDE